MLVYQNKIVLAFLEVIELYFVTRYTYIGCGSVHSVFCFEGAIAWLRLGGWMAHHLRNESGNRLCPLCNEQDSWEHIVADCPETELLRWQLLPNRFLMSERGRLACWDLIMGYESGNGICKYLVKVRKVREEKIRAQIG